MTHGHESAGACRLAAAAMLLAGTLVAAPATSAEPADLFAAVRSGDRAEVERLLDAGAAVDAADKYGTTPLSMAANNGHLEVARLLIERGADIDREDGFYGATPLSWALFNGHPEIARLLLAAGADDREQALAFAIRQGDVETARAAVEAGPIHASTLDELRAAAAELAEPLRELLAAARSRPDPEPPVYTAAELERFTGSFEGFASDAEAVVSLRDGGLFAALDGGEPQRLEPVAEQTFRNEDGSVRAAFFGRAGTIEGLQLVRGGGPPDALRRSVAEPVGARAIGSTLASAEAPSPESAATIVRTVQWPAFRGAASSGIGDGEDAPVRWDLESGEGVLWEAPLPGLGNSSPVVWDDRVFVTTAVAAGVEQSIRTGLTGAGQGVDEAVEHRWLVLAFDRRSGERLWETEVGHGVPLTRRHFKATQANSTPATDGRHLVAVFPTAGLACLGLDGELHWRHDLGGLNAGAFTDPGIEWGFASSPLIYGSKVILQVDVHDGPYLAAWNLESGEPEWRTPRDVAPSWATPNVVAGPDGDELVVNGSTIHGYDPETGEELWSLGPNSELVIATPVVDDGVVYVSAGYPPVKPIYALRAGLRGDRRVEPGTAGGPLVWSHGIGGAYMPTPLLYRGLLYVVHHNGRIVAYDRASGQPIYKQRFSKGGTFTASPVAVNGRLYVPTEEGLLYVLEAGPEYRELEINEVGEPLMATPAVSEGVLFLRTPSRLIAVGEPPVDEAGGEPAGR